MKKNLNLKDNLKASFAKEKIAVKAKSKESSIEQRIAKAEAAFSDEDIEPKNKEQKVTKKERIKVIRDTFTLPLTDYSLLDECKKRGVSVQYVVTKSEIVRAGLILLHNLTDDNFIEAIKAVKKIKTGRPKY